MSSNNPFYAFTEESIEEMQRILDEQKNISFVSNYDRTRPVIVSAMSSIGITFNVIVIVLIIVLKDYKKTSHWYVLNLAIADFIFLLMLPFDVAESLMGGWFFGDASYGLCIAYKSAFYINYYAGIFFLSVMSFDRYVAILHPISTDWNAFRSYRGSWIITIGTWVLAIVAMLPVLLKTAVIYDTCLFEFPVNEEELFETNAADMEEELRILKEAYLPNVTRLASWNMELEEENLTEYGSTTDYYSDDKSNIDLYKKIDEGFHNWTISGQGFNGILNRHGYSTYQCKHAYQRYFVIWVYCNFILTFVIPLVVLTYCYGCILWRVLHPRSSAPRPQRECSGTASSSKNRRRSSSLTGANNTRITLLVVSLVVVFVVCWMPFHIMNLFKIYGISLNSKNCDILQNVVQLIAFSNSILNPIFYTFLGASFHRRVHDVWASLHRRYSKGKTSDTRWSLRTPKCSDANQVYRYSSTKNTKAAFSTCDEKQMVNFEMGSFGVNRKGDLNSNNVNLKELHEDECAEKLVENST